MSRILCLLFLAGCGGASLAPGAVQLALGSGLAPSQVGSIEVLVLGGQSATCARALALSSPLDDPEFTVERHALFPFTPTTSARLDGIVAQERLVFYAESYQSPLGTPPRNGRGCTEATLAKGAANAVPITVTASQ